MSQNLGGYVMPREWVKGLSSLDSHTPTESLLIKPPSPWYLAALCPHAACGAQAFLLSLGSWGPPLLRVPPPEVLLSPGETMCHFLKHHPRSKRVHTSPRSCRPLPFPRPRRMALGLQRLTILWPAQGHLAPPQSQDGPVLTPAVNTAKLTEARKPEGWVHLAKIQGEQ